MENLLYHELVFIYSRHIDFETPCIKIYFQISFMLKDQKAQRVFIFFKSFLVDQHRRTCKISALPNASWQLKTVKSKDIENTEKVKREK